MADPRAENCKAFTVNAAGQVTGVYLEVKPMPSTRYQLMRAELIDEIAATGNIVASYQVLDKDGIQTGENVFLAWPYPDMTNKVLPGNPNNQHMIYSTYTPPDMGPLAMFVGDASGTPISDIIGGLGLPFNRHICFRMVWKERSGTVEPEPPPDPTPGEVDGAVVDLLAEIRDLIKAGFRL